MDLLPVDEARRRLRIVGQAHEIPPRGYPELLETLKARGRWSAAASLFGR